jgi:hypothetical protein
MQAPRNETLVVRNRGFLCAGCCGEVEVSLAERRENVPAD